jgi:hypothetical protein
MKIKIFLFFLLSVSIFFIGATFHKYKFFPFGFGFFKFLTVSKTEVIKSNNKIEEQDSVKKEFNYEIIKNIVFKNNLYEVNFDLIKVPIDKDKDNLRLGGYLEKVNENEIIFISPCGEYHILNLNNYNSIKKINKLDKKIDENFEIFCLDNAGIKDILYFNDSYFISTNLIDSSGKKYIGILRYSLINNKLIFREMFFKTKGYMYVSALQSGGRIIIYNDSLLFSIGDFGNINKVQLDDTLLGKIVKINPLTKEYRVYSKGHRNPQGLFYDKKNNKIIETEHGPMG